MQTRNELYGFYGTIGHHADADAAWAMAESAIASGAGLDPDETRAFLDSRHGRHFADEVANGLARGQGLGQAIDAAIQKFMAWRISRAMARETGIPAGIPYLTGIAAALACGWWTVNNPEPAGAPTNPSGPRKPLRTPQTAGRTGNQGETK